MNAEEKLCNEKTPKIFEDCKAGFFLICPHNSHRCAQLREEDVQKRKPGRVRAVDRGINVIRGQKEK